MKLLDRKSFKVSDIVNEIRERLNNIFGSEVQISENSKNSAKDRLQLVLTHDRSKLAPGDLEKMRDELVDVIAKYVDIDKDALDLNLQDESGAIALVANIPVARGNKQEAVTEKSEEKAEVSKETESEEEQQSEEN